METNDAFESGAEIEALSRLSLRQSKTDKGADAETGAYASQQPDERQPLLARDRERNPQEQQEQCHEPAKWTVDREFEDLPWWKTPSIWWLLPPFALSTTSFGGTIVIKINIVLGLICRNYLDERAMKDRTYHLMPVMLGGDNPQCQIPEVQSLVSKFTLYGSLISGILSAITSPKLGALSDRYGRTRMMAVSTFSTLVSELIFVAVARYPDMFSVNFVLVGYFFDGLGGSFIAVMAISYAFASDCTAPERRNVVFGYYQGCLFGGIALGPLFGGYVVKSTGNIISIFYVALACHCTFFLFLLFIVPETLSQKRQLAARGKKAMVESYQSSSRQGLYYLVDATKGAFRRTNILAPLSILWPVEPGTNPAVRRNLLFIAAVDTTMFGVAMGSMTVVLIYSEFMFGWGNFETNVYLTIVSTCRVLVLLIILPLITRILRGPRKYVVNKPSGCDRIDLGIIWLAICFDILGYVGFATVRTGPLFIACGAVAAIGGMGSPTLQSALTKHVPPDRTGQVLGAMGLLHAAARVVAPVIFNLIYAETVGKFSQTVFVSLAATWGVALLLALFIRPHVNWDEKLSSPLDETEASSAARL